jgi:hypothetical protein
LSRLTTHETKEIQKKKKNPGYFIQVYPVISRRFRRRGRRNNVFHASRTIMWGHLACQVNSLFLYILPQSSLLFFSPPFSIWENLVSWWCAGATHHVHCIVCYFLFSHSFSFILWFFFLRFFLSFSLQVSGSKLWQTERSCMCCQESGEREATVSLLCPKAAPGEPKLRRVNNNNNSSILEIVHFVVPA